MKKMFIAALTATAMCSYSYAQDDDFDEDDDIPAQEEQTAAAAEEEEEEEEETPAPVASVEKNEESQQSTSSSGNGLRFGLGLGLTTGNFAEIDFKVKLNPSMEVTAILGFKSHGATSTEANGVSVEGADDYVAFKIGAGFDYYLNMPLLPISAGAAFAYVNNGEIAIDANTTSTQSNISFELNFGVHAQVAPSFVLSGKAGIGIDYNMSDLDVTNAMGQTATAESSNLDIGIKAGLFATWYFM